MYWLAIIFYVWFVGFEIESVSSYVNIIQVLNNFVTEIINTVLDYLVTYLIKLCKFFSHIIIFTQRILYVRRKQKLHWALRFIYFLFEYGDAMKEEAAEAKEKLLASYEERRPLWIDQNRNQEAYKLFLTSTNAEVRHIALAIKKMFEV